MLMSNAVLERSAYTNAPTSTGNLPDACRELTQVSNTLVLIPGSYLPIQGESPVITKPYLPPVYRWEQHKSVSGKDYGNIPPVNGTYGLGLLSSSGEVIAVCGFRIEGNALVLSHTPQGTASPRREGVRDDHVSSRSRNELLSSDFRTQLTTGVKNLARSMNIHLIKGESVEKNSVAQGKIASNEITRETATRIIDGYFTEQGFNLAEDGYFYLSV